MLRKIRLLQIGDIHYPDAVKKSGADLKDLGVNGAMTGKLITPPLQSVIREISTRRTQAAFDGTLVCGDLTTYGDIPKYISCVDYLLKNKVAPDGGQNYDHFHVVPGNHDVDENKLKPQEKDLGAKFDSICQAWSDHSLNNILPIRGPRISKLVLESGVGVAVSSLNSCLGCRTNRVVDLPNKFKEGFRKLLDELQATRADAEVYFSDIAEKLDTPMIDSEHFEDVMGRMNAEHATLVPVILAHHNFLPQPMPRIAPYTEMLNGGMVRSRLVGLNKTAIYCHGHIHEFRFEVIAGPQSDSNKAISISAPEFDTGFNIIEIEFSSKNVPIGCTVIRVTRGSDGAYNDKCYREPLINSLNYRNSCHDHLETVIGAIPPGEKIYGDVRRIVKEHSDKNPNRSTYEDILQEAEWCGFVEIGNRVQPIDSWWIRKVSP